MSTKSNLHVFRGTYNECMAQTTENMAVYLAWDTQEIFIGNAKGRKVKYGGSAGLENQVNEFLNEFKADMLEAQTVPTSSNSTGAKGQYAIDTNYFYFCKDTDTWIRMAIDLTSW